MFLCKVNLCGPLLINVIPAQQCVCQWGGILKSKIQKNWSILSSRNLCACYHFLQQLEAANKT